MPVTLPRGRVRTLLAVLAVSAGKFVSTDELADRIWGAELPDRVRPSLQTLVNRLRHALGADQVETGPGGYALRVDPDQVDSLLFHKLLDNASSAGNADDEREAIVAALSLWRDSPFADLQSDWLALSESPRLHERYLAAAERRIDLDVEDTRYGEVLAELRELTSRHPLRESLWIRLFERLYTAGRFAEGLELYETARRHLADELGTDPGPELQAIHRRLLAPGSTRTTAKAVPRQLPPDLNRFAGRHQEMAALDKLFKAIPDEPEQAATIVVLHGEGGVGKTCLTVRWAHSVADRFPDGQLFLRLRGYGPAEPVSPELALGYMLRSLDIPGAEIPDGEEARTALLRTTLAGRRMLVILDDARSAEQVRPLIPGVGCVVVVTSRSQLRGLVARDGAHPIAIEQLPPEDARGMLHLIVEDRRGRLDDEAASELAALASHLPLALALVGERLARDRSLGTEELARQLRHQAELLDVLETGDDSSTELRAVFSWSYRTLEPETARMFRLLGLHPGPTIGTPAAAALAGITIQQARKQLDRLVNLHLLRNATDARFLMHDLLRAYATERTDQIDPADARLEATTRLLRWYLYTAAGGRRTLRTAVPPSDPGPPPPDLRPLSLTSEPEAIQWFDTERPSLLAAIRTATELGLHAVATELRFSLTDYLEMRSSPSEAIANSKGSLRSARLSGDQRLEALAANHVGASLGRSGQLDAAIPHLERALALFQAIGDKRGELAATENLGNCQRGQDAVDCLHRALDLATELNSDRLSMTHTNLAAAYNEQRQYQKAATHAVRAVELCRDGGALPDLVAALDACGEAQLGLGDHVAAVAAYREEYRLGVEAKSRTTEVLAWIGLGTSHRAAGEQAAARTCWQEALLAMDAYRLAAVDEYQKDDIHHLLDSLDPA
jgi:DNA-binding SARP family transcriptional activator